jgi:hypothetical protein
MFLTILTETHIDSYLHNHSLVFTLYSHGLFQAISSSCFVVSNDMKMLNYTECKNGDGLI